jgi:hypothetical protein
LLRLYPGSAGPPVKCSLGRIDRFAVAGLRVSTSTQIAGRTLECGEQRDSSRRARPDLARRHDHQRGHQTCWQTRYTRAVLPAISPTSAPDYPSRVRPPRQQLRLAVGAQFVMVAGPIYRRPIRSILLSRNRFTKAFGGQSARQGSELANPEPGSPCGQRNTCIITIIHR